MSIKLDNTVAGGLVSGPSSSTDNAIAIWDGTTGKLLKSDADLTFDGTNLEVSGGFYFIGSSTNGMSWASNILRLRTSNSVRITGATGSSTRAQIDSNGFFIGTSTDIGIYRTAAGILKIADDAGVLGKIETLVLRAGTATASTGPLKFSSGTLLTAAEAGAVEFLTDAFYGTITTGAVRKTFAFLESPAFTGTVTVPAVTQTGKITTYNNIATEGYGVPAIVDSVALTAQVADINATNMTNADVAGLYRVSYVLQDTTADALAGILTLTIAWTDGAGATTHTNTQVLTAVGRASGVITMQLASGNITYAVTHSGIFSNAVYALYITTERLL